MVNESSVARTVKALVTKHGPPIRNTTWLASFCGLREDQTLATINWLKFRKLVEVKGDIISMPPAARKLIAELVSLKDTSFMGFLDEGSNPTPGKEKKNPLARRLCRLYYEYLAPRGSKFEFYRNTIPPWRTQPAATKSAFRKAAKTCEELQADPQEFVESQFIKFDRLSIHINRPVLPQPHHFNGPTAVTGYLEFQTELVDRKGRRTAKAIHKDFTIEQEKLASLALFHRCTEIKVLAKLPHEFSRAFLKHKGG